MTNKLHNAERRKFLGNGLRLATGMTITGLLPTVATAADELPKLSTDNAMAKSLHYVEDASKSTEASHKEGQHCAVCNLYKGAEGSEWGACQIFQGKRVHSQGWCMSFIAKTG